ncbi:MAG: type I restriction endonuclease subunit R [Deltaproteobacteria bacterium]|nr:type I restriction endonuclease subunit R [Deltaproteobacteria bacterium]
MVTESHLEEACLEWFRGLGYSVEYGPNIEPEGPRPERKEFSEVLLEGRVRDALARLNPKIPADALDEAFRKIQRIGAPSLVGTNRAFHQLLVEGVDVEYLLSGGGTRHDKVALIDFDRPDRNDWLAVNQFTVIENRMNRRPDIVVFVNGLPLAVLELKNPGDEEANIWTAFNQLQTYKQQITSLFGPNELLVVSDGVNARVGSLTADKERFNPWRTIRGETDMPQGLLELEVLVRGLFEKERFLDYLHYFIVFEQEDAATIKKIAGYHQFHAVRTAVEATVTATKKDRRAGVVWHTQGSGKSLTMTFYAGRVIQHPAMENPTLVVITDRNDLDDQLFGVFSRCSELLRQKPQQAKDRGDLRELLTRASGGVIFTTIQKFMPEAKGEKFPMLSDRRNIVVIADEAHRTQYDFIDGFARHMRDALPNASFIGFTGTPIELSDKNTRSVFGDYISVYDIQRAVLDGATVPIYYESRLAKLELKDSEKPRVDAEFDEITEDEETSRKEKLKSKWAALEALVGSEKRIKLIAEDLVKHFENRTSAMSGKAMVVCMSRRICVDLYKAITALRPGWHDDSDDKGRIKVVMTGSADDNPDWQVHIRNKPRREDLAKRFKNPADPFQIVIVRDMWLTGFDAPCLHTMYVDKPMRGHGLMQAIARVNRVFKDKPGGLVVDYLGLADQLKYALATYTESGGQGSTAVDQAEAVAVLKEKFEICQHLLHGFEYRQVIGKPREQLALLPMVLDFVIGLEDGRSRFLKAVADLSKAFALAAPHEDALAIRDEVAFLQMVQGALAKTGTASTRDPEDIEHAIRQLVSSAVAPTGVIDIFAAAGLKKPDISILSDEFLAEIRGMPHRNLALETLKKLLNDEIRQRSKRNLVQSKSFSEMLEKSVKSYQNRAIETAKVIEELIELAKEMRKAQDRGDKLGLSDDELAFYDALEVNDSAVKVLGDDTLRNIARELVEKVRKNATIDWTVKESVRAKLRSLVKVILKRYGYPPDKQEKAIQTVLSQAELFAEKWAA